jgi:succinoglycan biosynthesis protein ExoM
MLNDNDPELATQRVAICVCTYKRPKMLGNCLESLAAQLIPSEIRPLIIVIDNEAEPNNEAAVLEFEKTSPFEVAYWHEPERGIAIAKNTALRIAIDSGAEWIAFIEDDKIADPKWLANLMDRQRPMLSGQPYRIIHGA